MLIGQNSHVKKYQLIGKESLAPRARFELATLRLTAIRVTLLQYAGAGVFRGESSSCDEARESTSLPCSPFVRGFSTFFHDYRDSGVTGDPSGNNRMLGERQSKQSALEDEQRDQEINAEPGNVDEGGYERCRAGSRIES